MRRILRLSAQSSFKAFQYKRATTFALPLFQRPSTIGQTRFIRHRTLNPDRRIILLGAGKQAKELKKTIETFHEKIKVTMLSKISNIEPEKQRLEDSDGNIHEYEHLVVSEALGNELNLNLEDINPRTRQHKIYENIIALPKEDIPDREEKLNAVLDTLKKVNPRIPKYLDDTYWWAYLHPFGVWLFERQWMVEFILYGNYTRLANMTCRRIGLSLPGKTIQLSTGYGSVSKKFNACVQRGGGEFTVVDVAPIQIENLRKKINDPKVKLYNQDATNTTFDDNIFDNVVIFFLLHEIPEDQKRAVMHEAFRICKPGGQITVSDFHGPHKYNPHRYFMICLLSLLEPYAMALWDHEIIEYCPKDLVMEGSLKKETCFGNLFQVTSMKKKLDV